MVSLDQAHVLIKYSVNFLAHNWNDLLYQIAVLHLIKVEERLIVY